MKKMDECVRRMGRLEKPLIVQGIPKKPVTFKTHDKQEVMFFINADNNLDCYVDGKAKMRNLTTLMERDGTIEIGNILSVQVPEGVAPDQKIVVSAPSGSQKTVIIPEGKGAGEKFHVMVSPPFVLTGQPDVVGQPVLDKPTILTPVSADADKVKDVLALARKVGLLPQIPGDDVDDFDTELMLAPLKVPSTLASLILQTDEFDEDADKIPDHARRFGQDDLAQYEGFDKAKFEEVLKGFGVGDEVTLNDKTGKVLKIEDGQVQIEFKDAVSGKTETKWVEEEEVMDPFSFDDQVDTATVYEKRIIKCKGKISSLIYLQKKYFEVMVPGDHPNALILKPNAPLIVKFVNLCKRMLLKKSPQPRDILELDVPQVPSLWDDPYKHLAAPPPSATPEGLAISEENSVDQRFLSAWLWSLIPADDEQTHSVQAKGAPLKKSDDEPVRKAPRRQSTIMQGRFSLDNEDSTLNPESPKEKKGLCRRIVTYIGTKLYFVLCRGPYKGCGLFCACLRECCICIPYCMGNCICKCCCFCFYKYIYPNQSTKNNKEVELPQTGAERADFSLELTMNTDIEEVALFDTEAGSDEADHNEEDDLEDRAVGRFSNSMPSILEVFLMGPRGFVLYLYCFTWKLKQLCKLTFGYWDRELVECFNIQHLSEKYDENPKDDVVADMDLIQQIGIAHSLFWMFIPGGVVLAKIGEQFNRAPMWIDPSYYITQKHPTWIDHNGKEVVLKMPNPDAQWGVEDEEKLHPQVQGVGNFLPKWVFNNGPLQLLFCCIPGWSGNGGMKEQMYNRYKFIESEARLGDWVKGVSEYVTTMAIAVLPTFGGTFLSLDLMASFLLLPEQIIRDMKEALPDLFESGGMVDSLGNWAKQKCALGGACGKAVCGMLGTGLAWVLLNCCGTEFPDPNEILVGISLYLCSLCENADPTDVGGIGSGGGGSGGEGGAEEEKDGEEAKPKRCSFCNTCSLCPCGDDGGGGVQGGGGDGLAAGDADGSNADVVDGSNVDADL